MGVRSLQQRKTSAAASRDVRSSSPLGSREAASALRQGDPMRGFGVHVDSDFEAGG